MLIPAAASYELCGLGATSSPDLDVPIAKSWLNVAITVRV